MVSMYHWWNDKEYEKKQSTERKPYLSATLSSKNPTWTGLELKPGLPGHRLFIILYELTEYSSIKK